jgi:hypothetical protein
VGVVGVDVGVEGPGVEDQRDGAISEARISSIRSETSLWPLRPLAAALRRRRPPAPRCCSSAVRVTSAIVTPRRSASWRSRASRSSGSFTVVRRMGMPAYHLPLKTSWRIQGQSTLLAVVSPLLEPDEWARFRPAGSRLLTTILSMRLAGRLTAGGALAITVCWALALAFAGSTDVLLFLAPALLVAAPLVAGRYVGETLIVRIAARRSGPRRRPSALGDSTPPATALWLPRGTRLLAFSLAKRPPPVHLLLET